MMIKMIVFFILLIAWFIYFIINFISLHDNCRSFIRLLVNKESNKASDFLYSIITDSIVFLLVSGVTLGLIFLLIIGG